MARAKTPWRDRAGRFSALKFFSIIGLFVPAILLALDWYLGNLGPRPITEAIHATGQWTERLLLGALAITPMRFVLRAPRLVLVRRMLGVGALVYALAHVFLYALDEKFRMLHVATEIFVRFYLTIGFVALLGLVALGATSTDRTTRWMGKKWKRLHRAGYAIAALTVVHYTLQARPNISGPALAFGIFVWLLLWRTLPTTQQQSPLALLLLTLGFLLFPLAKHAWDSLQPKPPDGAAKGEPR